MNLQTLSPASIASTVWSAAARTLTSLGTQVIQIPSGGSGFPAAMTPSSSANITPPNLIYWQLSFAVTAGANGTFTIDLFNGIVTQRAITIAAGQSQLVNITLNHGIQMIITNNDALNTVPIIWSGVALTGS